MEHDLTLKDRAWLLVGRTVGRMTLGGENASIARVIFELKLQDEEEGGWNWDASILRVYHRLCWLDGIRGFDKLSPSQLAIHVQALDSLGLSVPTWIRNRIQRGATPDLDNTNPDTLRRLWSLKFFSRKSTEPQEADELNEKGAA